jgi:hypothetical protein
MPAGGLRLIVSNPNQWTIPVGAAIDGQSGVNLAATNAVNLASSAATWASNWARAWARRKPTS